MMTTILGLAAMGALMALFTICFYWYCRRIRDGRINLYTDPEWTSITGPASPRSLSGPSDTMTKRSEYDDDHVAYRQND
ncbi:hypothetical protein A5647_02610 [Mycobacterium sp. 1100029.7]|nr:hypothetical protein A5647_02610 [Mycobacterium sp. 1100029.7]